MSTLYSIGQMNQLADALEAAGFTPDEVTKLRSKTDALKQFKPVLSGLAEIVVTKHVIDCTVEPHVPDGWSIHEEDQLGSAIRASIEWNPDLIDLYVTDEQRANYIVGKNLKKKLEGKRVLTANVLDYLLANPNLIPEEWKGKAVFFWGNIYRDSDGGLYVRCLCWDGEPWGWNHHWLGYDFSVSNPAALLASN